MKTQGRALLRYAGPLPERPAKPYAGEETEGLPPGGSYERPPSGFGGPCESEL